MLGLHVLVDQLSGTQLDELAARLRDHEPLPWLTVMGGSKFNQAVTWAQVQARDLPDTRVLLRHWPDDGQHRRVSARDWLNAHRGYADHHVVLMPDNESTADDLSFYANWMREVVSLAGQEDIGVSAGRFAVGNPRELQYDDLLPMWVALTDNYHLSNWGPNEYFNLTPGDSVGAVGRFTQGWAACDVLKLQRPPVLIGEYGLAANFDPHKGWRKVGWSWAEYLLRLWTYHEQHYLPWGITPQVFSVGAWHGFELSLPEVGELLTRNEQLGFAAWHERILRQPLTWVPGVLEGSGVQLRQHPSRSSKSFGVVTPGQAMEVVTSVQVGPWQLVRRLLDRQVGWVHLHFAHVRVTPTTVRGTRLQSPDGQHSVVAELTNEGTLLVYLG